MSIASEITRINTNIANSYTAVSDKGGILPSVQNSNNLPNAIRSISSDVFWSKEILCLKTDASEWNNNTLICSNGAWSGSTLILT